MKTNVEKVLERDQKLSELDDRAGEVICCKASLIFIIGMPNALLVTLRSLHLKSSEIKQLLHVPADLTSRKSAFCPVSVFMCFV